MRGYFKLSSDLELIPDDSDTAGYISRRKEGDVLVADLKIYKDDQRTVLQNSCLHEYISDLSNALNEGGYDVGTTITVKVNFTPETVKEYMFKKVMKALYPDKTSTKQLSTIEISEVYENLNRMTAERFGIGLQWPSRLNTR